MILLRRGLLSPVEEDMNINSFISDSIPNGNTTKNIALTNEVNLSKASIIVSWCMSTEDTGKDALIEVEFLDSGNISVTRNGTTGQVYFQLTVVEFPKAISVQFFTITLNSAISATQTITEVDSTSNQILLYTSNKTNGPSNTRGLLHRCQSDLTNDTTVTVSRGTSANIAVASFFVVEIPSL